MGQFTHPNAGCAFKNDYACGIPSGKLIDESGLRGYSIGGAAVFERHANFVVNTGSASAEDVRRLINHIRDVVLQKQGIRLEEEVRYLGFTD
jgi:UDP-N-acetylmuramate dehydrogenase